MTSEPTMPRIFVSHSHQDNDYCREFVAGLREHGYQVWYDEHNLDWGPLRLTIEKELFQCQHFIAVLSPAAVASDWVNTEIDAALDLHKRHIVETFALVMAAACEVPLLLRRWKRIEGPNGAPISVVKAVSKAVAILAPFASDPPSISPKPPAQSPLPPTGTLEPEESVPPVGSSMKALQQMQNKMVKMQEELQNSLFEGSSGGDVVKVSITGKFELVAIKLDPEVVDAEDIALLEDLVLVVCQDAFTKAAEAQVKMMEALTSGMKLPPGMAF